MKNSYPLLPRAALAAFLVLPIMLTSCATAPSAPPPTNSTTISCRVPTIAVTGETTERQDRGGVEISVVPVSYRAAKAEVVALREIEPNFGQMVGVAIATGGNGAKQVYVEETTTSALKVEPGRLQFTVRINNKLARVFRGQGAVVQFNIAGKLIDFGQTDYKEFMNGIVPPRNEAQFTIYGPAIDELPDNGTIGLFLYDVVTATDTAGNTTEKQNFEWYFTFEKRAVSESVPVVVKRGYMDPVSFQQRMARQ